MTMVSAGRLLGAQRRLWSSPWMQASRVLLSSGAGDGDSRRIYATDGQINNLFWKNHFAYPDHRWDKGLLDPKSPDCPKSVRKLVKVDGLADPVWMNVEVLPDADHLNHGSQKSASSERSLQKKNRGGSSHPADTRESRQSERVDDAQPTHARKPRPNLRVVDARVHKESSIIRDEIAALTKDIEEGISVDSHTCVTLLQRCLKQKDFTSALEVHECIMRSGMEQNTYVANNLLRVYLRCGKVQEAREVFDRLVRKSVITWTIMIGGYVDHNRAKDAFEMLDQMRREGAQANEVTYLCILKACADPEALKWGQQVHADIKRGGFQSDVRVGTALLKMYAKCGSIKEAREVFNSLTNRDIVAWTAMIGAYAECGCGREAYELFLQMQRQGFKPDAYVFASLLHQRSSAGALEWVRDVHAHAVRAGLELDVRVANGLVTMYAKCGLIENSLQIFDRMVNRDLISWNVMIGAYAERSRGAEAYKLFRRMQHEGFTPDASTYLSILNPKCASAGAPEWVKKVHATAHNVGLDTSVNVGTALVRMYASASSTVDAARDVFDQIVGRDVASWNVMIGAYAGHGRGAEADQLFLQLQQEGLTG